MEPIPKARARTVVRNGKVYSFTPRATELAQWELQQSIPEELRGAFPKHTPVRLKIGFYFPRPGSIPKKRRLPTTRPDLDNYLKLVQDALNKIVYDDDAQITTVYMGKRYGSPPRIEIVVEVDE
ncbi:RusA family crossover junction endodeoxyribonuclease [Chloroflexota bacterium]